jgi:hypothetical protein
MHLHGYGRPVIKIFIHHEATPGKGGIVEDGASTDLVPVDQLPQGLNAIEDAVGSIGD